MQSVCHKASWDMSYFRNKNDQSPYLTLQHVFRSSLSTSQSSKSISFLTKSIHTCYEMFFGRGTTVNSYLAIVDLELDETFADARSSTSKVSISHDCQGLFLHLKAPQVFKYHVLSIFVVGIAFGHHLEIHVIIFENLAMNCCSSFAAWWGLNNAFLGCEKHTFQFLGQWRNRGKLKNDHLSHCEERII